MPDDLRRTAPEDPNKINVAQPWELAYWANKFGVSQAKLILAVRTVGPMVADVKRFLGI